MAYNSSIDGIVNDYNQVTDLCDHFNNFDCSSVTSDDFSKLRKTKEKFSDFFEKYVDSHYSNGEINEKKEAILSLIYENNDILNEKLELAKDYLQKKIRESLIEETKIRSKEKKSRNKESKINFNEQKSRLYYGARYSFSKFKNNCSYFFSYFKVPKKALVISVAASLVIGIMLPFGLHFYENSISHKKMPVYETSETMASETTGIKNPETLEQKIRAKKEDYIAFVEKGDSLYKITKKAFNEKNIVYDDKHLDFYVNEIAVYNGKVKMGQYKSGMDPELNPSFLKIGDKIAIPSYLFNN